MSLISKLFVNFDAIETYEDLRATCSSPSGDMIITLLLGVSDDCLFPNPSTVSEMQDNVSVLSGYV